MSQSTSPHRAAAQHPIKRRADAAPAPGVPTPEEPILDAKLVAGMGYAESKWIVERMLQRAPLPTLAVRVGQLAGGRNGCWNAHDWVPVIVRSARVLGCLPDSSSVRISPPLLLVSPT